MQKNTQKREMDPGNWSFYFLPTAQKSQKLEAFSKSENPTDASVITYAPVQVSTKDYKL